MEQCSGITFYKFIAELDKHFDEKFEAIQQNLEKVKTLIFNKQNGVFVVTGDADDYRAFEENSRVLKNHLMDRPPKLMDHHFELKRHNVGIANSSKVQYVAKGYNFKELGYQYTGHLQVLKTIISLNYLWNKIRIEGGAYGAMTNFSRSGNMFFTSYRDPHLNKTIDAYNKAEEYVREFEADEREMTKYILGTISKVDAPMTPSAKGEKAATYYFCNITHEDLEKEREEIVRTTVEDIKAQGDLIRDVMATNYLCVVGNEHKLKDNKDLFNEIDYIFK
jgi:presequence protease